MRNSLKIIILLILLLFLCGAWQATHYNFSANSATAKSVEAKPYSNTTPTTKIWREKVVTTGEIEPRNSVVSVAPSISGVISEMKVEVGQQVTKGQPLYTIDDKLQRRDYETLLSELNLAVSENQQATISAQETQRRFDVVQPFRGAGESEETIKRLKFDAKISSMNASITANKLEITQGKVKRSAAVLDKLVVRSPIDGVVLGADLKPGEYISPETAKLESLQIGDVSELIVRAHVDIDDIYAVDTSKPAMVVLRDSLKSQFEVHFLRSNLLAKPKVKISGRPSELIDTKTIDMFFVIPNISKQLYVGQEVDLNIVAKR